MNNRRGSKRRLSDMSQPQAPFVYTPPPREECDSNDYVIPLTDDERLEVITYVQQGLIVDFAIMQIVDMHGVDAHVARIDCCHGTVHRHVYDSEGNDLAEGRVVQKIPEKDSARVVDSEFAKAYDKMLREWEANERRWRR